MEKSVVDTKVLQGLTELHGDFKSYIGRTGKRMDDMQKQLDAIDAAGHTRHIPDGTPSLEMSLKENEGLTRMLADRKGRAYIKLEGKAVSDLLERKSTITSGGVGYSTSGVLGIERIPGIVAEARQTLRIRDVLTANPTTQPMVDFVKVTSPMAKASPQVEASSKFENAVTFAPASEKIRTIATWIPASRQVLDDYAELTNFLNNSLGYYVNLEEELQLLGGDGTGENLHGFIPQAAAFDTTLLAPSAGWNKIDVLGRAAQQVMESKELQPTFAIVHPRDWWGMRLAKDAYGRYILGDPQAPLQQSALFDLTPVVTTSIAVGTFLVGSGAGEAAEIRDRMELMIELSTEHADFFVKNLVAIRAEKRMALVVKRPGSYVSGSFTTSPA